MGLSRCQQVIQNYERKTRYATKPGIIGDKEDATRLLSGGCVQGVRCPQPSRCPELGGFSQNGLRDGDQAHVRTKECLFILAFKGGIAAF